MSLAAGAQDFPRRSRSSSSRSCYGSGTCCATRRAASGAEAGQNRTLEETIKQRTARLVQSEKVATTGSLLAGRRPRAQGNPMAVLSGQAQLLFGQSADPVITRRALKISEAADRCVRIVRNFLSLARQRPPERTETSAQKGRPRRPRAPRLRAAVRQHRDGRADGRRPSRSVGGSPSAPPGARCDLIANADEAMRRHEGPRRLTVAGRYDRAAGRVVGRWPAPGPGFRRTSGPRSSRRSSPRRRWERAPAWGCRSAAESSKSTRARSPSRRASATGTTFVIELPVVAPPAVTAAAPAEAPVMGGAPSRSRRGRRGGARGSPRGGDRAGRAQDGHRLRRRDGAGDVGVANRTT